MHGGHRPDRAAEGRTHTDGPGATATLVRALKIPTGIEGLDGVLEGGLPKQEIYLVQDEPGSGKTARSDTAITRR
jgi:RecA/RadA recombinase